MLTNKLNLIEYDKAKALINEGDVLLFRGSGFISKAIGRFGEGIHSHVAIASWHNQHLECIEFREWKGGRVVSLKLQVDQNPNLIDVYRVLIPQPTLTFEEKNNVVVCGEKTLDMVSVTRCMRKMTGLPYGWKRICCIARHKIPILRGFYNVEQSTIDDSPIIYPVCSTAVASCFSTNGFDLVKNRSDQWTEPADLARSSLLQYLFTLSP